MPYQPSLSINSAGAVSITPYHPGTPESSSCQTACARYCNHPYTWPLHRSPSRTSALHLCRRAFPLATPMDPRLAPPTRRARALLLTRTGFIPISRTLPELRSRIPVRTVQAAASGGLGTFARSGHILRWRPRRFAWPMWLRRLLGKPCGRSRGLGKQPTDRPAGKPNPPVGRPTKPGPLGPPKNRP